MKVKVESEKVGLKLNIQKTKIMVSGPVNKWETVENSERDGNTRPSDLYVGQEATVRTGH